MKKKLLFLLWISCSTTFLFGQNATTWNAQEYDPAINNQTLNRLMGYNTTLGKWSYYDASIVRSFLGMPTTGESLQSITDRGFRTTRPIILSTNTANYTYIGGNDVGFARIGGYSTAGTPQNFIINQDGGNVGIGTISPAYKLDVNGSAKAANVITLSNEGYRLIHSSGFISGYNTANNSRSGYLQFNNGANVTLAAENTAALNLMTSSSTRLYIHSNGNIGIGTGSASVNYKLAVNGSVNVNAAPLTLTNSASDNSIQMSAVGASNIIGSFDLAGVTPKKLLLNPNGGNVGIGTTDPGSYKLAVEGTLGVRKIKVTGEIPWADYVFDSSYQLTSLHKVEEFIRHNKHLPDVPSAAEVKQEGLDLSTNQAILLKKIEELTLYIIQQNKELIEVKQRLTEIEAHK